jgi:hypothetical protein
MTIEDKTNVEIGAMFIFEDAQKALKEEKRLCKEFSVTTGMLKGWLARGRG